MPHLQPANYPEDGTNEEKVTYLKFVVPAQEATKRARADLNQLIFEAVLTFAMGFMIAFNDGVRWSLATITGIYIVSGILRRLQRRR